MDKNTYIRLQLTYCYQYKDEFVWTKAGALDEESVINGCIICGGYELVRLLPKIEEQGLTILGHAFGLKDDEAIPFLESAQLGKEFQHLIGPKSD